MGHRHMSYPFIISGLDQQDNNHLSVEQSCIPIARDVGTQTGPFVAPMNRMLRDGIHLHSSNVNMEVRLRASFSRPPVDPYTHLSSTGNTSLTPMTHVGHIHYSHYNIVENGAVNSTDGNGGIFKRKSPMSEFVERGNSTSFYGAGSSSSSQMFMEKPDVDRRSLPPYRGAYHSIVGEDPTRNVRSRMNYYEATTHSASISAPAQPVNLSGREWNSVPRDDVFSQGRTSPPDINGPRHETSQLYAGGSSMEVDASHYDSFFSRHPVSSSQHPYVSHAQSTRDGHHYHSQTATPSYMNGPSYYYNPHGFSSSSNGLQFPMENSSSRYTSHSSAGVWGSGYRRERPRIAYERPQPSYDGLGHETLTVDRSSFYSDSGNALDQYQDMRLDVDNMSYEELLALEETIGDVGTGLSEDMMSRCLRERAYSSVDQNHEEATCPICLEEYRKKEKVGRMEKCGHEYHMECIKKWLVLKKVCPICKSECNP